MKTNYKQNLLHRARIVRGHFDTVIKMIESDAYCLDITQQTHAIQSALKKIDEMILEHHLKTCVKNAIISNTEVDERVKEIIEIFHRK